MVALDVKALTTPLSDVSPCGIDVRSDTQAQALYFELKDARNSARTTERSASASEPTGVVPLWNNVNAQALQILTGHSKDIEILCWLAEAQLRLRGFAGLGDVFEAMHALVDTSWPDLHSVAEDTVEDKVAPLTGMNGQGSEGVLIQALRLAPLIPDESYGRYGLWDYQRAQRPGETALRDALYQAASENGPSGMRPRLTDVERCLGHFNALTQRLDALCGADAPPSSNIRQVLEEAAAAIREMGGIEQSSPGESDRQDEGQPTKDTAGTAVAPAAGTIAAGAPAAIGSREEAFEVLLSVARFFRRTEPHSPTAQALETMVRRGRMDFQELLGELLPDSTARAAVLTAAGIQPKVDRNEE